MRNVHAVTIVTLCIPRCQLLVHGNGLYARLVSVCACVVSVSVHLYTQLSSVRLPVCSEKAVMCVCSFLCVMTIANSTAAAAKWIYPLSVAHQIWHGI